MNAFTSSTARAANQNNGNSNARTNVFGTSGAGRGGPSSSSSSSFNPIAGGNIKPAHHAAAPGASSASSDFRQYTDVDQDNANARSFNDERIEKIKNRAKLRKWDRLEVDSETGNLVDTGGSTAVLREQQAEEKAQRERLLLYRGGGTTGFPSTTATTLGAEDGTRRQGSDELPPRSTSRIIKKPPPPSASLLRYVMVILDWSKEIDTSEIHSVWKPSNREGMATTVVDFVSFFHKKNPISMLGVSLAMNGGCEVAVPISGNSSMRTSRGASASSYGATAINPPSSSFSSAATVGSSSPSPISSAKRDQLVRILERKSAHLSRTGGGVASTTTSSLANPIAGAASRTSTNVATTSPHAGKFSLQACIELAEQQLKQCPAYGRREVILCTANLATFDKNHKQIEFYCRQLMQKEKKTTIGDPALYERLFGKSYRLGSGEEEHEALVEDSTDHDDPYLYQCPDCLDFTISLPAKCFTCGIYLVDGTSLVESRCSSGAGGGSESEVGAQEHAFASTSSSTGVAARHLYYGRSEQKMLPFVRLTDNFKTDGSSSLQDAGHRQAEQGTSAAAALPNKARKLMQPPAAFPPAIGSTNSSSNVRKIGPSTSPGAPSSSSTSRLRRQKFLPCCAMCQQDYAKVECPVCNSHFCNTCSIQSQLYLNLCPAGCMLGHNLVDSARMISPPAEDALLRPPAGTSMIATNPTKTSKSKFQPLKPLLLAAPPSHPPSELIVLVLDLNPCFWFYEADIGLLIPELAKLVKLAFSSGGAGNYVAVLGTIRTGRDVGAGSSSRFEEDKEFIHSASSASGSSSQTGAPARAAKQDCHHLLAELNTALPYNANFKNPKAMRSPHEQVQELGELMLLPPVPVSEFDAHWQRLIRNILMALQVWQKRVVKAQQVVRASGTSTTSPAAAASRSTNRPEAPTVRLDRDPGAAAQKIFSDWFEEERDSLMPAVLAKALCLLAKFSSGDTRIANAKATSSNSNIFEGKNKNKKNSSKRTAAGGAKTAALGSYNPQVEELLKQKNRLELEEEEEEFFLGSEDEDSPSGGHASGSTASRRSNQVTIFQNAEELITASATAQMGLAGTTSSGGGIVNHDSEMNTGSGSAATAVTSATVDISQVQQTLRGRIIIIDGSVSETQYAAFYDALFRTFLSAIQQKVRVDLLRFPASCSEAGTATSDAARAMGGTNRNGTNETTRSALLPSEDQHAVDDVRNISTTCKRSVLLQQGVEKANGKIVEIDKVEDIHATAALYTLFLQPSPKAELFLKPLEPASVLLSMMRTSGMTSTSSSSTSNSANTMCNLATVCACHRKLVNSGMVCSGCLSVYCEMQAVCGNCGTRFQNCSAEQTRGFLKAYQLVE
ncbi:unnamed protein product [Amoebophrya sp. A120]|nr:unnamed protein product [Amoebophrya sp. A120]|eukprot:GSA120T00022410001.1